MNCTLHASADHGPGNSLGRIAEAQVEAAKTMSGTSVLRLSEVRASISNAAQSARREPSSITLIVVSKTFAADDIRPLLEAGHKDFGENACKRRNRKWPALKAAYPDIRLHLIGPLQSNKAKEAVALFDAIHSIDRRKSPTQSPWQ